MKGAEPKKIISGLFQPDVVSYDLCNIKTLFDQADIIRLHSSHLPFRAQKGGGSPLPLG